MNAGSVKSIIDEVVKEISLEIKYPEDYVKNNLIELINTINKTKNEDDFQKWLLSNNGMKWTGSSEDLFRIKIWRSYFKTESNLYVDIGIETANIAIIKEIDKTLKELSEYVIIKSNDNNKINFTIYDFNEMIIKNKIKSLLKKYNEESVEIKCIHRKTEF